MKTTSYSILLLLLIFSCNYEDEKFVMPEMEHKNENSQNLEDSSWTYTEYKNEDLSIDVTNHNLKNISIQINRKKETLNLDLNELNIPWKTPELSWINNQMICITNWWSGPFGRYIFIPLNEKLNNHIYIDKDIEIADSLTNNIVYVDTVIYESKLILTAENLINRKKKSIEIKIPTGIDYYPFYDSLSLSNSSLDIWINGKRRNFDINSIN